ncbi:hypothetical protein ONZ51_g4250 [Trametes cubensis]|uniref:Uncharacterized protein n=1 Tax=Trametes cubensis TaxID=1111947 RepID=A0AAD7TWI6_9APHY|nr:hypothetical protein ONZ51_g4250 [Trametes cubensis]
MYATSLDARTGATICCVSRIARRSVLPTLYASVVLSSSKKIKLFLSGLAANEAMGKTSVRSSTLVRRLWIGPVSKREERDLFYASKSWPVPEIRKILALCTRLRDLALINVYPMLWPRLTIPATLTSIAIGPLHARVHVHVADTSAPASISSTVKFDTYGHSSWKVELVGLSPFLCRQYRFYPAISRAVSSPVEEHHDLPPILSTLLELTCHADTVDAVNERLDHMWRGICPDPRLLPLRGDDANPGQPGDEIAVLHAKWESALPCAMVQQCVELS